MRKLRIKFLKLKLELILASTRLQRCQKRLIIIPVWNWCLVWFYLAWFTMFCKPDYSDQQFLILMWRKKYTNFFTTFEAVKLAGPHTFVNSSHIKAESLIASSRQLMEEPFLPCFIILRRSFLHTTIQQVKHMDTSKWNMNTSIIMEARNPRLRFSYRYFFQN